MNYIVRAIKRLSIVGWNCLSQVRRRVILCVEALIGDAECKSCAFHEMTNEVLSKRISDLQDALSHEQRLNLELLSKIGAKPIQPVIPDGPNDIKQIMGYESVTRRGHRLAVEQHKKAQENASKPS